MTVPVLISVPSALESERLRLRTPHAGDGELLHEALAESLAQLRRFLASLPWVAEEQTVESAEIYCRKAHANHLARTDLPFLVFRRDTHQLVGCVGLHRPDWALPKLEVGYWCRTSQLGNGFVTEAVNALVSLACGPLGAVRLELITDEQNRPSRRVAERCGFTLEGILRNERRAPDGSLRNTCVYARTTGERSAMGGNVGTS
jgi:hypothetical protein